jgi:hypothetical protein
VKRIAVNKLCVASLMNDQYAILEKENKRIAADLE